MADLSSYTKIIKEASGGETVRDAFIQLLKFLNTMEGSIGSLNGHPESYFATARELYEFIDIINDALVFGTEEEDRKPQEDSTKMLTSGLIYEAVDAANEVLKDINHEVVPLTELLDNIKRVEAAKDAIGRAIRVQSGGTIKKKQLENFENYPTLIRSLISKTSVNTSNPTLTENKDYEPNEDNEDPGITYAYKRITTNVKFKTETKTVRGNITLTASGESIGFSKVSVNTSSTSTGSGRSGSTRGGSNVDENGIQETFEINENGTHTPKGAIGWRTVVVNVTDIDIDYDAKYTVNFYDSESKNKLVYSAKEVPYNGSCACPEDLIPTQEGLYFAGWEPAPFKIREDTDCIAQFTDQAPSVEEISYTWDQIVEARGANCPIGSYKTLHLENGYGDIKMQKVYAGEDGSTSSWVAMNPINSRQYYWRPNCEWGPGTVGWSGSSLRKWLNESFFYEDMPELLRDNIVEVTKYSFEYNFDYASKIITEVRDKIWMPSLKEILGNIPAEKQEVAIEQNCKGMFYVSGGGGAYNNEVMSSGAIRLNWGFRSGNSYSADMDMFLPEYKGVHYKDVYPSWTVTRIDSGDTPGFWFGPDDASKCTKENYPYSGSQPWYTRSCTIPRGMINSNHTGLCAATFNASSGGYEPVSKAINVDSGSFNEGCFLWPIIGFCL